MTPLLEELARAAKKAMKPASHSIRSKCIDPASQRQSLVDTCFEYESHYWESVYGRPDPTASVLQERARRALQWIKDLRLEAGTRVLDAGCGAGPIAVALARNRFRVHAIDHVPAMLELAGKAAEQAGVEGLVALGLADICSLEQFPDNYFGLAVSLGVIGWLESPQQAIAEMHRVLRPGGYLILSVGNAWSLQDVFNPPYNPVLRPLRRKVEPWLRRRAWVTASPGPERPLTRWRSSEINRMLAASGLEKVKGVTVGFGPFHFFKTSLFSDTNSLKLHRKLQSWADRKLPVLRSAGAIYLVLAYKPR